MRFIKPFLFALFLSAITSEIHAQHIDEVNGKTYYYYDSTTQKKVKEIFHHKLMIQIIPDRNNYGSYRDTTLLIKNGPYTRYYETGELQCSGYYADENKDGIWKFYNKKGELIRTEKWKNGQKL